METKAMYEKRLKEMRDIKNVEDFERKKTFAEGREQERKENLAEKRAMAKAMLADGMAPELVAKYTQFSIEEVLTL